MTFHGLDPMDSKVLKGLRSYWHPGRGTKCAQPCLSGPKNQSSLRQAYFFFIIKELFNYSIFLLTENLNARAL